MRSLVDQHRWCRFSFFFAKRQVPAQPWWMSSERLAVRCFLRLTGAVRKYVRPEGRWLESPPRNPTRTHE